MAKPLFRINLLTDHRPNSLGQQRPVHKALVISSDMTDLDGQSSVQHVMLTPLLADKEAF